MKVIVLVILSLLVSCVPPKAQDSILNYKGGKIINIYPISNEYCKVRLRMYDKIEKRYVIKIIYVSDADNYIKGQTIK